MYLLSFISRKYLKIFIAGKVSNTLKLRHRIIIVANNSKLEIIQRLHALPESIL